MSNKIRRKSQFPKKDEAATNTVTNVNEETVEEHEQTIYKGILSTQIKLVKTFSLLTSAIGLSCQPILLYQIQVRRLTQRRLFYYGHIA